MLADDVLLDPARQTVPYLTGSGRRLALVARRAKGGVDQEHGALGGLGEHVDAIEELGLVTGDELRLLHEIGGPDRVGPKRRCDVVREPDFFES